MTTYTIKPNELEAIALGASNEEVRYYMCGVLFEQYPDGKTALITTDGHRLMSVHAQQRNTPDNSFILANADVKKVLAMAKGDKAPKRRAMADKQRIVITAGENCELALSVVWLDVDGEVFKTVGSFTTSAVGGNFPDWRRVIPSPDLKVVAPSSIGFNGAYMADFAKASKLLSNGNKSCLVGITITSAGGPILIEIPETDKDKPFEFMGVLMPHRL